jgi:hypothetical protein
MLPGVAMAQPQRQAAARLHQPSVRRIAVHENAGEDQTTSLDRAALIGCGVI